MALNPFTSFRKYQRYWMAVILLLTMVTFVLCTGTRGDLSEQLLTLFGRRGGSPVASVNGRNIYRKDLDDLKEQRNVANEFMKRGFELGVKKIAAYESSQSLTPEQRKTDLPKLLGIKADLEKKFLKTRYFGTGVKLDELVDFEVWLNEADRLGINLVPDDVRKLFSQDLLHMYWSVDPQKRDQIHRDQLLNIIHDMRVTSQRMPTEPLVVKALGDEYRVRIAQMTLAYSDPGALGRRSKEKLDDASLLEVRMPLSPAMLWDAFKQDRSAFDVALLEVDVNKFTSLVTEPSDADLNSLFKEHYKERYDPAAPSPGFEIPPSTRVELIVGDPTSPKFKQWSTAATLMEATPPVWIPYSPLTMLARYAGGPLAERKRLAEIYEQNIQARNNSTRANYLTAKWDEPDSYLSMAAKLASKHADAAASWVAGYAQPSNFATAQLGFYVFGPVRHPDELLKGMAEEAKARVPFYAPAITGGAGSVLETLGMLGSFPELDKEKFLPLDIVTEPLTEMLRNRLAETWVHNNMDALRKKLQDFVGNKAKFERELRASLGRFGLERFVTKDFYNRFTIDKAPELQPLLKAFDARTLNLINTIEGRNLTPKSVLKEGDFYKLFFDVDGPEDFSVGNSIYRAKPWPPVVVPKKLIADKEAGKAPQPVDLFDEAVKPMLFWKIEDRAGKIPDSIDLVRDKVKEAWKFEKARDTQALPKAKELADKLQKSELGAEPVLEFLGLESKRINLKGVAPMYTALPAQMPFPGIRFANEPGERVYTPYQVPKDTFSYPRDDMAQEVLGLANLKKPIEIGVPKLDEYNKALFDVGVKTGRVVQILTNKPRSAFYVACVPFNPGPSLPEFRSAMKYASKTPAFRGGAYEDLFVDQAFENAGKKHLEALLDQLRTQTDTKILVSAEERKSFDANEAL